MKQVKISENVTIGSASPLVLMAGPCVMEPDTEMLFTVCRKLQEICQRLGISYIFKTSYDKANRTSPGSFRGPGVEKAAEILSELKKQTGVPLVVDIHSPQQAEEASCFADILQIPAFLCRQTDLLTAAGRTDKVINIKKGQFLAPDDMKGVVQKIEKTGNDRILLTERGSSFGYHNLVVDMRSFSIMKKTGYPVVFDATHSVQLPGAGDGITIGERHFVPVLARAAVAAGADAVFMEVHPDPDRALCDAANQYRLSETESLLKQLKSVYDAVRHD